MKVKRFHDAEARVIEHLPGTGRHKGRLGALACQLPDGTTFSVGSGFTDAQRERPPAIGATITFRYQELSIAACPAFPRSYANAPTSPPRLIVCSGSLHSPRSHDMTRRFEFVGGKSAKFYEVVVAVRRSPYATVDWGPKARG